MRHEWTFPVREIAGNYDGDTVRVGLDLGFHRCGYFSVRLNRADTPELKGGTEETRALARYARDRTLAFLQEAETVVFHCTKWAGKYGRPIGDFYADGNSLCEFLIAEGLAVPYDGGSRRNVFEQHVANATAAIAVGMIQV